MSECSKFKTDPETAPPGETEIEEVGRLLHSMHEMSARLPWEELGAAQEYFLKRARILLSSDWFAKRIGNHA